MRHLTGRHNRDLEAHATDWGSWLRRETGDLDSYSRGGLRNLRGRVMALRANASAATAGRIVGRLTGIHG